MLKELQDIGLSEKEAKVYLAALEIGRATADQLAKQAQIVRSTTYVQIESLMKMGLMSTYEEGKKTYFAPESPEYLKRFLEQQKQGFALKERELSGMLPDLTRMFESAGERPVVRFYNGKEGIKALREETLNAKDGILYVMSSNDALTSVFSEGELEDFSRRRSEKEITTKLLYTRAAGKFGDPHRHNTERGYLPPESLPLATDIVIFDDSVGIMTLKGTLLGVLVKSAAVRDSMRAIFEFLWKSAEKH
jgi:HTH-type transcriptional regulator, sugar sensing transcriptional regulator